MEQPTYQPLIGALPISSLKFASLPSTQRWCVENIERLKTDYGLTPYKWVRVSATTQTAGIGQCCHVFGKPKQRRWVDATGSLNVSFVTAWPRRKASRLSVTPLVLSYAVARTLEELGLSCRVKWINDILVRDRKISGVLVTDTGLDLKHDGDDEVYAAVVLGIGINVLTSPNADSHPEEFEGVRPTSIADELRATTPTAGIPSVDCVLEMLTQHAYTALTQLELRGFHGFHAFLNERLVYRGDTVIVDADDIGGKGSATVRGVLLGLSASTGCLQLDVPRQGRIDIYHGRLVTIE